MWNLFESKGQGSCIKNSVPLAETKHDENDDSTDKLLDLIYERLEFWTVD